MYIKILMLICHLFVRYLRAWRYLYVHIVITCSQWKGWDRLMDGSLHFDWQADWNGARVQRRSPGYSQHPYFFWQDLSLIRIIIVLVQCLQKQSMPLEDARLWIWFKQTPWNLVSFAGCSIRWHGCWSSETSSAKETLLCRQPSNLWLYCMVDAVQRAIYSSMKLSYLALPLRSSVKFE